ncbi:MAG: sulfurtransferase complex subunit TusD [Halioglobus sp.]
MPAGVFYLRTAVSLIYSLLVLSSPASGHSSRSAALFARSLIARGHSLHRVFFLDTGVLNAAAGAVFPQDELNPTEAWISLAEQHAVELTICISSALRYAMLDQEEADRHDCPGMTIHPLFSVSGLGQLIDASANSDRLITFGG